MGREENTTHLGGGRICARYVENVSKGDGLITKDLGSSFWKMHD